MICRRLGQADHPEYERFLSTRAETSMFLRSNARAAGLDYAGEPLQARCFGAFEDGRLEGVLALAWNGNLMAQAPLAVLDALLEALAAAEPEVVVKGVVGPGEQVARLLDLIDPPPRMITLSEREPLFRLDLDRLKTPGPLASGALAAGRAGLVDLDLLVRWRTAYDIETLGGLRPEMQADPRAAIAAWIERTPVFLIEADGAPVAMAAWNAALPDMVQIGGVFTPPELRGRGHGRAAVAAALIAAREAGARTAILFTHTPAAERAYRALGFEQVGCYHIALFEPGLRLGELAGC
jgi:GNAT superfamily N-acetyltransferase